MTNAMLPLLSCLCVTRKKPAKLKRAIGCFLDQTYPNKELVVLLEDDDPDTMEVVGSFTDAAIRVFVVPSKPKLSLGRLRNLSIARSCGEYFCQWDDDDWYHEKRLEIQLDAVLRSHKPVSILAYWMMYDEINHRSFLSPIGPWPGTILCKKSIIGSHLQYPDLSQHEDMWFMKKLIGLNYTYPVIMPCLYIYAYHGENTFNIDHFNLLYSNSQQLPEGTTEVFRKIFSGEVSNAMASEIMLSASIQTAMNYFHHNSALPA